MISYFILAVLLNVLCCEGKTYQPNWPDIDSRPLPSWYDEAKVGIFMHFGPYSVPAVQSEWFWLESTQNGSEAAKYMADYYAPKFRYQNFGSQLTMEFFNASQIADIVAGSGAKYFVFTSKHHDGFTNWPSTYTFGWNSMDVGAKRNVVGELSDAFRSRHPDVHFGLYYSLFEWFNPMYLKDKANKFSTREYVLNKMQPEMKELVTKFRPDVLWVDGDWEAQPEYWGSQDMIAWLYNDSPSKDSIVTNDRWGIGCGQKHGGYYSGPDRFDPGTLQDHKWEDAMTVDSVSWGHRRNINIGDVLSMDEMIKLIAKTVSCGGNILINVGPTKEGTIIPIFQERLRDIGSWLGVNGEAIYKSQPWVHQNDTSNPNVWYTRSADASVVYAIVLGWPDGDVLRVSAPRINQGTMMGLVGLDGSNLQYRVNGSSVDISFPPMSLVRKKCSRGCDWAYVVAMRGLQQEYYHSNDIDVSISN